MGGYLSSGAQQAAANLAVGSAGPDTVLIPVDQSDQSETAFEWYIRHLHKKDNEVKILHCLAQPHITDDVAVHPYSAIELDKQLRELRENGKGVIAKYENKLNQLGVKGSVEMILGPRPEEIVIDKVNEDKINYVVMGSRGFGMVRRTILGSVSHYVICHSDVPVCVIPKHRGTWF